MKQKQKQKNLRGAEITAIRQTGWLPVYWSYFSLNTGKKKIKLSFYVLILTFCTKNIRIEIHLLQFSHMKVKVSVTQSCLTLCDLTDCSLPGSSVHGILQARISEHVIPFLGGSSQPRDWTWVSCIAGKFFTICHHEFTQFKVTWKVKFLNCLVRSSTWRSKLLARSFSASNCSDCLSYSDKRVFNKRQKDLTSGYYHTCNSSDCMTGPS